MKHKKLMLFIIAVLSLGYGCKRNEENPPSPTSIVSVKIESKKYNPYALDNMRKTLANLLLTDLQLVANNKQQYVRGKIMATSGTGLLTINGSLSKKESTTLIEKSISATHYHIKFMPTNEADYAKLKADSNLVLYPFPLDAAVSQYNGSYRDPAVPAGLPTYQYAAIPVNYVLPNVPYVKLADLYLPNEQRPNSTITVKGDDNSSYSITVEALVNESLCNTTGEDIKYEVAEDECGDNYGGGGSSTGTGASTGEWRPNGRVTVYDEILGQTIGVEGIKVRARRWFTTYTGITDANGYYHVNGTYTRPANYWLNFERYDFAVRHFVFNSTAEVSGPKIEAPWNVDFSGYDKFCATIFRAAHHYYYKDIQGLRRPPENSFWATQVAILANPVNSSSNGDTFPPRNFLGIGSLIHIKNPDRSVDEIYATTIHELAHAVHWEMSPSSYYLSASTVNESWATGVQWALTKMVYPLYKGKYCSPGIDYRNVVVDMIDPDVISYPNPNFVSYGFGGDQDQVEGYTIVQVQNSLIGPTTWNEWKDNIKNNYSNATAQHMDALFDAWLNY